MTRRIAQLGRLTVAAFVVLVLADLAPPLATIASLRSGLHAPDGGASLLTAAAATVAWGIVGWLTMAVLAAGAAALPGRIGRLGAAVADRITPTLMRRLLAGGTVAGLALAPALLPAAATAATRSVTTGCAGIAPSMDRAPLGCPVPTSSAAPTATASASASASPRAASLPRSSDATPRREAAPGPAHATADAGRPATVVARRGDSLWHLAHSELQAAGQPATASAVAHRWPAWWAVNRAELGADPGLIHPGEVLRIPTA